MLYAEFITRAENLTIEQAEESMIWYLNPEWVDVLYRAGLSDIGHLEDSHISTWADVEDILNLEVKRRNAIDDKKHVVVNWLYDIISQQVRPTKESLEDEIISNLTNMNILYDDSTPTTYEEEY